uniref:Uncharacterized protein n=1 Tax=Salarias fasciatus TaxID=181472 RepID=A0A672I078_SALFA
MFLPAIQARGGPSHTIFIFIMFGVVQVMGGLFNVGLGPGRTSLHPDDLSDEGAAYWLGAVFISVGIVSLLVGSVRGGCYLGFCAFMNVVGSVFSIVAIVLYAADLSDTSLLQMCGEADIADPCTDVANIGQRLLTGMNVSLIVLSGLLLAVSISLTVTSICAIYRMNGQADENVGFYCPLPKDVQISRLHV